MTDVRRVPVEPVTWRPCFRLIASRYPTVGLYDAIADPADLEVVFAIEALTNPRIRDAVGQLELVPVEERVSGPGSTLVMAAFTHLNPEGSRFSSGHYGVYYAAQTLETAVIEVSYHRAKFMASTRESAIDVDMRLVKADLDSALHDLRRLAKSAPGIYDATHYAEAQALGASLREAGSRGVVYNSVRHAGGSCVGVFRPKALSHARSAAHIALHWDGQRISHWYYKREPTVLG